MTESSRPLGAARNRSGAASPRRIAPAFGGERSCSERALPAGTTDRLAVRVGGFRQLELRAVFVGARAWITAGGPTAVRAEEIRAALAIALGAGPTRLLDDALSAFHGQSFRCGFARVLTCGGVFCCARAIGRGRAGERALVRIRPPAASSNSEAGTTDEHREREEMPDRQAGEEPRGGAMGGRHGRAAWSWSRRGCTPTDRENAPATTPPRFARGAVKLHTGRDGSSQRCSQSLRGRSPMGFTVTPPRSCVRRSGALVR